MSQIFENLRVVELASVLAGPAVGTFFSELGADVIKIENKTTGGDVTRKWRRPAETSKGPSAYYASVNWDKQSVFLDLRDEDDHAKALKFIKEADIVISNFKKGDDKKFGLTYDRIKEVNSSIIYAHISGFGKQSDRIAYDLILQAETGFMSINGQPDGPPTKMPLAMIDLLAAHQLKEGILCALIKQKEHPNQSFSIEVSLYESAVSSLINQATNWLMNSEVPQRIGSLHPNIAPYGEVFETKDQRSITLATGNDRQFEALCNILEAESLAEDAQFANNRNRVENRQLLEEKLHDYIKNWTAEDFLKQCEKHFVPAAEIKNIKQVFESAQAQEFLLHQEMEGRNTIRPKTAVFKLEE